MKPKSATTVLVSFAIATSLHSNVLCGARLIIFNKTVTAFNNVRPVDRGLSNYLGYFSMTSADLDSKRIYGGAHAKDGQFPFMAVVHRLLGVGRVAQCGGTILSPRWVLTAGHCIANTPRNFFVVFGILSKAAIGYDFNTGPGVSMLTNHGALHPQYTPTTNDIGLLHMPRDIPFSRTIQPIKLASHNYATQSFANRMATVIGWGRDQYANSDSKGLKYATLPIISNFQCSTYWGISDKHICTVAGYGQDACQGDSGGPLMVMENGRPLQVGIVSYGDKNCPSSKPGVFARVTAYIDWIEKVTRLRL